VFHLVCIGEALTMFMKFGTQFRE